MSHLPRILLPAIVLATLISGPAFVLGQVPEVPNPVCAYCGCSLPNGVHTAPECRSLSGLALGRFQVARQIGAYFPRYQ